MSVNKYTLRVKRMKFPGRLTASQVLLTVAGFANEEGLSHCSLMQIAETTHLSPSVILDDLHLLRELGLVIWNIMVQGVNADIAFVLHLDALQRMEQTQLAHCAVRN